MTARQSISTVSALAATVSLRSSNGQQVSSNDSAGTLYQGLVGTRSLGMLAGQLGPSNACVAGNELVGVVTPSTSTGPATIKRFVVSVACYVGSQQVQGSKCVTGDDTGGMITTNPSDAGGDIFNLDLPGVYNPTATPARLRVNFIAYAVGPDGVTPISPTISYFARISCLSNGIAAFSYDANPGDNQIGLGTTSLTWNLQ